MLAGLPVGAQGRLELGPPGGDRLGHGLQLCHHRRDRRSEPGVTLGGLLQPVDLRAPLSPLTLGASKFGPQARQLGLKLRPAPGSRAFVGRGAAALDGGHETPVLLCGFVPAPDGRAVAGDGGVPVAVKRRGPLSALLLDLAGGLLGLNGSLADAHQLIAPVALSQDPLVPQAGRLAKLAGRRPEHATLAGGRQTGELIGQRLELIDHPGAGQQASGQLRRCVLARDAVGQALGTGNRWRCGGRAGVLPALERQQHAAAIASGPLQHPGGRVPILHQAGTQTAVQGSRHGQLISRRHRQGVGQ